MLRIAIWQNNSNDQKYLTMLFEEYKKKNHLTIYYEFFSDTEALNYSVQQKKHYYNVFILDILSTEKKEIILINHLKQNNPRAKIIFLSVLTNFVEKSYDLGAYYYMLKPLQPRKIFHLLNRLTAQLRLNNNHSLLLRSINGFHRLPLSDIIYIEAMQKKYQCHLIDNTTLEGLDGFTIAAKKLLHCPDFIKPHRSYVVNLNYIRDCLNNELRLLTNVRIPLARSVAKEVQTAFIKHHNFQ